MLALDGSGRRTCCLARGRLDVAESSCGVAQWAFGRSRYRQRRRGLGFSDFPLLAKLTRWGNDAHMGLLSGLANQIVLALPAVTLLCLLLWGYRMWWLRGRSSGGFGELAAGDAWRQVPGKVLAPIIVVIVLAGYFAPLLEISLVAFVLVDIAAGVRKRKLTGGKQ